MQVLKEYHIKEIVNIWKNKNIIIYPTDTLYGFLGDATSIKVINKIIKIKKRPINKPFLVLINENLLKNFYFPKNFNFLLIYKVTIITKSYDKTLNKIFKEIFNTSKIGFRIPKKYFLLKAINKFNKPIVAPSANISGKEPIKHLREAKKFFEKNVKFFVQGKISKKPSSILEIIDKNTLKILRKGEDFEKILSDCIKRGIKIQR